MAEAITVGYKHLCSGFGHLAIEKQFLWPLDLYGTEGRVVWESRSSSFTRTLSASWVSTVKCFEHFGK